MKLIYNLFLLLCFLSIFFHTNILSAQSSKMYVGTYTSGSESKGVYVYDFDEKKGETKFVKTIEMSNPSFLARKNNVLYAVNEDTEGMLTVYDLAQGKVISHVPSGGQHPCHVSLSPRDPLVLVSNYSSGSLSLFSLSENGGIKRIEETLEFKGSSINRSRQQNSHIHSAFFTKDGNQVFVSDLGADLIYIFEIINTGVSYSLNKVGEIRTKSGGGPRHLAFSKDEKSIFSVLELTGEIEVFQQSEGNWISKQLIAMYPDGFKGEHGGADIKIDHNGKYIYATNRGTANLIYQYTVTNKGLLKTKSYSAVYGDSPRNVNLSPKEKYVLVSNQNTNNIEVLKTNMLKSKKSYKKINIFKPVCVIF